MQFSRLSLFKHRVQVGQALPFNVFDADKTLMLARGLVVESAAQLAALLARGALVDIAELSATVDRVLAARKDQLPALWTECMNELGQTLRQTPDASFRAALDESSPAVMALVARDPDLAIFQVLRQQGNKHIDYGVNHSMHAAITAQLVASRLGWDDNASQTAFKAALTMNLAMLELQGQLAEQTTPLTDDQRAAIQAHPELSRMLLEMAGVTNEDWLQAVAQHHESAYGRGYPYGLRETNEVAALIRRADIYAAKLSPRATREAMAADQAGRQMFMQDPGHPMTAALVKEFGVYPPGCWVRLASGESGMVIRRGPTVMAPLVSVMTSAKGQFLPLPVQRDTSHQAYAVKALLAPHEPRPKVPAQLLMKLALA